MKIREIYDFIVSAGYSAALASNTPEADIADHCPLSELRSCCFTWVKRMDTYGEKLKSVDIPLLIVTDKMPDFELSDKISLIIGENPKGMYFDTLTHFFAEKREYTGIAKTAVVLAPPVNIGKNVSIGENTFICADAIIGENTVIGNNVVIESKTRIGKNCYIGSGTIIGCPGFGYFTDANGVCKKVPDFGGVTIGDNVEIGASNCISRGTLTDTIVEDMVKTDNLIHIGHNAHLGKNCLVTAMAMFGGSSTLKDDVYIAPGALIMNQITIGADAFVGMGAVVTKNVDENKVVAGVPARVLRDNKQR